MARKKQRANVTRDRLLNIREARGWREAAEAANIPKRVRVSDPNNKSGFGYRTLTDKQRREQLGNRIRSYTAGSGDGSTKTFKAANLDAATRRKIKRASDRIPLADRAVAGYRVELSEQIREKRAELADIDDGRPTGMVVTRDTAREELQAEIRDLQERRNDRIEEQEIRDLYNRARDLDTKDAWDDFKYGPLDEDGNRTGGYQSQ